MSAHLKLANPIVHQVQPTSVSCTATCVAMAVGIPVQELGVNLDRCYDFDHFGVWLAERGLWLRRGIRNADRGERYFSGRVYLVGVRSLNVVAQDHAVLLDTRGPSKEGDKYNERSGWCTFDPNMGREGKAAYHWVDENVTLDFCEIVQHDGRYSRAGSPPQTIQGGSA